MPSPVYTRPSGVGLARIERHIATVEARCVEEVLAVQAVEGIRNVNGKLLCETPNDCLP